MISESEKAVLDEFKTKNPKIKIPWRRKWLDKSSQSGYFIEDNGISKLRITHKNKLTSLPDSFGNLVNLKKLDLRYNELTSLPESFGNLVNLEELNL